METSPSSAVTCAFCALPSSRIVARNAHGVIIRDAYPVTPGHTLVIPTRHVGSFFDLGSDERIALLELLDVAKAGLEADGVAADGYNIGINDGPAAGQTVPHLHIHLIPRRSGDVADPRGGVRWVIAEKAEYWNETSAVKAQEVSG